MTRIKLCGLTRPEDIDAANELRPEYVGFVFAPGSRRRIAPEGARTLRERLAPGMEAVGVFVREEIGTVARLANEGIIDLIQLHGGEDADDVRRLRALTARPILQAFRIRGAQDVRAALESPADYILLDSGAGTGRAFDWEWIRGVRRPYFLAGGLTPDNVAEAVRRLKPYAVDVSSGIETDGRKDREKMAAFVAAVRKEEGL